jgi:hypothetical protein
MDIAVCVEEFLFDIQLLKSNPACICRRDYIEIKDETENGYENGRNHIRIEEPVKTDSAGQYSHNCDVRGKFGCEKYYCYKYKQRAEHVYKIRNKIGVIVKDNSLKRGLILNEVVYLLAYVKNYYNTNYNEQCRQISADELSDNVSVQYCWFEIHKDYNLVSSRFTMLSFQGLKSPAAMCFLASFTSQR